MCIRDRRPAARQGACLVCRAGYSALRRQRESRAAPLDAVAQNPCGPLHRRQRAGVPHPLHRRGEAPRGRLGKNPRGAGPRGLSRLTAARTPILRTPDIRTPDTCEPVLRTPGTRMPDAPITLPHHPPPWQGAPGTDTKQRVHPPTGGWTLSSDVRQSAAVCAVVSGHCCRSLHQPFPVPAADPYLRPPCPAVNSGPCFRRLFRPQHQPLRSLLPAVISVHSSRPPTSGAAAGRYFQRLRGYLPSAIIRSMLAISAGLSSL